MRLVEGELQQALGENLRAFRATQGVSQEAFADAIGVHRTYVGSIERGERNLSLRAVERLAERMGVGALSLLQPAGSGPTPGGMQRPADPPARRRPGLRARRQA